ncbi:MAG TPA: polysaccharide biosynthesis/export family protein, partial [Stellaceae bacterium]|nr:polysaccharide biosynthesis/export family protein [Stellaceae bacterium]
MKPTVLFFCLMALSVGGCSWIPRSGPSTSDVLEQGAAGGEILFDVVQVDDRVVNALKAQPKERFALRFQRDAQPPEVKIAIGDTVSVLIWESAAGGLFSEAPAAPAPTGGRSGIEPLAPESRPPAGEFGIPRPPTETGRPQEEQRPNPGQPFSTEAAAAGRRSATIPDQEVGADGAISVPYAGRIPAAGRLPAEVQQAIEARLAEKALGPQVLVIVKKSAANAVTVLLNEPVQASSLGLGETSIANLVSRISNPVQIPAAGAAGAGVSPNPIAAASAAGTRVPLSPGGDRLLQIIAAAGGAKAPVHETFVRLSRGGVTATIPLEQLVGDPAEDLYARPGDVVTLVRVPQTFSVFGATGRNAEIAFGAQKISLSEALGKSQGLRDDLAKPEGVFLFRYEPNSVVRALDQPIAAG